MRYVLLFLAVIALGAWFVKTPRKTRAAAFRSIAPFVVPLLVAAFAVYCFMFLAVNGGSVRLL